MQRGWHFGWEWSVAFESGAVPPPLRKARQYYSSSCGSRIWNPPFCTPASWTAANTLELKCASIRAAHGLHCRRLQHDSTAGGCSQFSDGFTDSLRASTSSTSIACRKSSEWSGFIILQWPPIRFLSLLPSQAWSAALKLRSWKISIS